MATLAEGRTLDNINSRHTLVHDATTTRPKRKFVSRNYVSAIATSFIVGLAGLLMSCANLPTHSHSGITYESSSTQSCDRLLAELDFTFDQRRQVRQDSMRSHKSSRANKKFDLFEPEAVCFSEERFGKEKRYSAFGDGPKFVCGVDVLAAKSNSSAGGCLVYSIGSNNDIDFEKGVGNFLGCETHTFDPTLTTPFVGDEYAVFHPWGLGQDGENGTVSFGRKRSGSHNFTTMSLETIMQELGHRKRTIDILKIDCEGCEYNALPPFFDLIASGIFRVNQLQVELHATVPEDQIIDFFLAADRAKLRIFHKERNGWGCNGHKCVEYSFASEDFLREANGAVVCH